MPPRDMIFTSAGDNTDFVKWWCSSKEIQNYDMYVYYYGKNTDNFTLYEKNVTHIERSIGSKFQNFYKFWKKYPEVINEYDRFFILDDDIEISCEDINKMFNLSREYNLDICGPSFTSQSKVSHEITKYRPNILLSYTNFVEVNTPLFSRDALNNLMKVYNPVLIGWGIDILYVWANGFDKTKSYAIVHSIQCTNPKDDSKRNKSRELGNIKDCNIRSKVWDTFAKNIKCPNKYTNKTYSDIPL